jgi:hypothetical protein
VALELLSIPAYLLAGWRKRDLRGNEASLKYYLLGVFASAVMLYGMSLIFGVTGSTVLTEIGAELSGGERPAAIVVVGILFTTIGFAFKVSAVPFHTWAPDTYEGAPTPVTAFLSVASKAAGFVALLQLVFIGFLGAATCGAPLLGARRHHDDRGQPHRPAPDERRAHAGRTPRWHRPGSCWRRSRWPATSRSAGADRWRHAGGGHLHPDLRAMNLGAFAVVLVVARKTRSVRSPASAASSSTRPAWPCS